MRKRAALIRTLVYDPPIILMDEPFAAVDAQTRTQLQADLLRLWDLGRKTIIFVTHDITEAIALGDRALVLSEQPSRIAAEHAIPIPRPRNVKDIFALPGFAATYERSGRTCNDRRPCHRSPMLPARSAASRQWLVLRRPHRPDVCAARWAGRYGARTLGPLFFAPPLETAAAHRGSSR